MSTKGKRMANNSDIQKNYMIMQIQKIINMEHMKEIKKEKKNLMRERRKK